ncbi:hypothetical protein [Aeromonas sobria]|uniref:hypothetical protein n=1 Tax=Aeromonas sobria TaxID=646 RepID=UPI000C6E8B7F|nr:hypothetical protein [Aeromonas sobria]PKQ71403.1 hypothetical protein CJF47_20600 [Aeromonas sobria]
MTELFKVGDVVKMKVLGTELTIESISREPDHPVMVTYSLIDKDGVKKTEICPMNQFISAIEPARRKPITFTF